MINKVTKKYYCIFCNHEIEPEASLEKDTRKGEESVFLFQCDNPDCEAIYESPTLDIKLKLYNIPVVESGSINMLRQV
jgi:transcription elongation factor Elf1